MGVWYERDSNLKCDDKNYFSLKSKCRHNFNLRNSPYNHIYTTGDNTGGLDYECW